MPLSGSTVTDRPPGPARLVLRGGALADGRTADIAIDQKTGTIIEVGVVRRAPGDVDEDCSGMVVVPSGVEVHGHLDKALTCRASAMPADLPAAIAQWRALAPALTVASFVDRATAGVEAMVRRGYTSIRTHVDVTPDVDLRAMDGLVEVRRRVAERGLADLQLVALAGPPVDADQLARLEAAVAAGADVVGGSPDLAVDPVAGSALAVEVAARHGLPIDLHTDQTTDAARFDLPAYIDQVARAGLPRAAASHCVSLASQPLDAQRRVADRTAEAGIAVFTMPLTSLFYFGWDEPTTPPRGVTAIHALLDAGVTVAAGGDNVRDPFFPLGGFDPLETAAALAMVAHLTPEQAWRMCSDAPRTALGLPAVAVAVGSRADLLAVAGATIAEAVAVRSDTRTVLRRGHIVARTTTSSTLLA